MRANRSRNAAAASPIACYETSSCSVLLQWHAGKVSEPRKKMIKMCSDTGRYRSFDMLQCEFSHSDCTSALAAVQNLYARRQSLGFCRPIRVGSGAASLESAYSCILGFQRCKNRENRYTCRIFLVLSMQACVCRLDRRAPAVGLRLRVEKSDVC